MNHYYWEEGFFPLEGCGKDFYTAPEGLSIERFEFVDSYIIVFLSDGSIEKIDYKGKKI